MPDRLNTTELVLGYNGRAIIDGLSVSIPDESFTVIAGPNACGKSTLLRGIARMLKPRGGTVELDGHAIKNMPTKEVAKRLGLLPQSASAPDGITTADLVARGRFPHQKLLRQWSVEDERIVNEAMAATGVESLAKRYVDELSGGQRQRVWIAMALAQQTPILLLDEPTTFLDISHQVEILDLCTELNEQSGRTVVTVLHDLNLACRYASHLLVMAHGVIVAEGEPTDIITAELVEDVFNLKCRVIPDPETDTPLIVPLAPKTARAKVRR